ncbi:hypothetical protein LINPERPRIM_LOCUS15087, partial [Linum perenne]
MARSKTKASKKKHGQPLESSSPQSPTPRSSKRLQELHSSSKEEILASPEERRPKKAKKAASTNSDDDFDEPLIRKK